MASKSTKKRYRLAKTKFVYIAKYHMSITLYGLGYPDLYRTAYTQAQAKTYFTRYIAICEHCRYSDVDIDYFDIELVEESTK